MADTWTVLVALTWVKMHSVVFFLVVLACVYGISGQGL